MVLTEEKNHNLLSSPIYLDIKEGKTSDYIIEKYILHNVPYYFKNNMDLYYDLKKRIALYFRVSITNIFLVGSGQFGFSLCKEKGFRDFIESEPNETDEGSDLDIAIISTKIFDTYWDGICDFNLKNQPRDEQDEKLFAQFKDYLYKGWIRPDKFPFTYDKKKEWFDFFRSIQPLINRKVTCGIFRNEVSFLKYYSQGIDELAKCIKEV